MNKEVETFSCEGKCHLMSQLEAAESPDEQNQKEVVEEQRIVLFSLAAIALPVATSQEVQNKHWNYLDFYQFNYTFSIFHPPRLRTYLN